MKYEEVFSGYKKEIDSIKYSKESKKWKVDNRITIGWENVLPYPPKNSSETTRKEIEFLARVTERLSVKDRGLVLLVDDDPFLLYKHFLNKHGLSFDKSDFDKVWNVAYPIIMNLKYKFNRPRPYQIDNVFGLKVNVEETETHQTPAYPSGHTCYAAFYAYLLSDMYPEYSSFFFNQVGVAGYARTLQGVHYPSDNEAAMTISGAIWQDIRYKMFPSLTPYEKSK
jgi:hypothetical protein